MLAGLFAKNSELAVWHETEPALSSSNKICHAAPAYSLLGRFYSPLLASQGGLARAAVGHGWLLESLNQEVGQGRRADSRLTTGHSGQHIIERHGQGFESAQYFMLLWK